MWKKIKSKIILKHPRLKIIEDTVLLPNKIKTDYLRIVEKLKNGVTILCLKNDKILIQKEYSYPVNMKLFQFPGGKVERGEKKVGAVKRELLEESGIIVNSLKKIGWYYTNNRRSNSKMYVFTAKYVDQIKKNGGDQEESIESKWILIKEMDKLIKENKIINYSVLAAWALFKIKNQSNKD